MKDGASCFLSKIIDFSFSSKKWMDVEESPDYPIMALGGAIKFMMAASCM